MTDFCSDGILFLNHFKRLQSFKDIPFCHNQCFPQTFASDWQLTHLHQRWKEVTFRPSLWSTHRKFHWILLNSHFYSTTKISKPWNSLVYFADRVTLSNTTCICWYNDIMWDARYLRTASYPLRILLFFNFTGCMTAWKSRSAFI